MLDISELGEKICENMKNYRNVSCEQKINTMHEYMLDSYQQLFHHSYLILTL